MLEARFPGKRSIGSHPTLTINGWNIEPQTLVTSTSDVRKNGLTYAHRHARRTEWPPSKPRRQGVSVEWPERIGTLCAHTRAYPPARHPESIRGHCHRWQYCGCLRRSPPPEPAYFPLNRRQNLQNAPLGLAQIAATSMLPPPIRSLGWRTYY